VKEIQMVDLVGQYNKIKSEVDAAVLNTIGSGAYIQGPEVQSFASNLSKYLDIPHIIPCANGTDALQIALMALDLPKDAEILVPAFTYVASAEVIALLGFKPVFVEVEAEYFGMDVTKLANYLTEKTKVIMPVHLFGQISQMEEIMAFAKEHHLYVIEDVAQAIAAKYTFSDGRAYTAGGLGHIATTSFFPTKNLGCMGDGGAIFTNDENLAIQIKQIANHGQLKKYTYVHIGVNSRLDTLQACILNVKLKYLDTYIQERQQAAAWYDELLAVVKEITIPARAPWSTHVFHQYTLQVENGQRDGLKKHLESTGIPAMIYYPGCIHLEKAYQYLAYEKGSFPVSESLTEKVLSLPMHTELSFEQVEYIVAAIKGYFNKA
jgi:UDP-2-acetamido-2-deoxy-ribo-hexuluronate aminotransferase